MAGGRDGDGIVFSIGRDGELDIIPRAISLEIGDVFVGGVVLRIRAEIAVDLIHGFY